MIKEDIYNRILNSLDDNEKTCIKEMNKNCFVKENEIDQTSPLEKQKSDSSHSNSDTKKARENEDANNVSHLRNDITNEILEKLESIENQLGDSLQNRKCSQGIQTDIQDSYIENFNKRLNGTKRKISEEHDEIESKMRKLNKGTKRKISDENDEIESKMRKLNKGTKRKISDENDEIESKMKKLRGTKRKISDEHEEIQSKMKKLRGTKRKISDEHEEIESKMKKLRGTKRNISDEHDEIQSKITKLNRGTKRNNHFHNGNQQKKRRLCFDIWE